MPNIPIFSSQSGAPQVHVRDPYLTDIGLAFQLACDAKSRTFVISIAALELLGQRYGYTMNPLNLYRAHEAVIHAVARFLALDEKSDVPILMDAPHFRACDILGISIPATTSAARLAA